MLIKHIYSSYKIYQINYNVINICCDIKLILLTNGISAKMYVVRRYFLIWWRCLKKMIKSEIFEKFLERMGILKVLKSKIQFQKVPHGG